MMFAASIVYFDPTKAAEAQNALAAHENVEISLKDIPSGKLIVIIESESELGIEDTRKALMAGGAIQEITHHAFYFGDEVEKVLNGEQDIDIDFETLFKKHKNI